MYYINTTQADTNSWQHTAQVQDWRDQQNHHRAHEFGNRWARGWTYLDVQETGHQYKVHYRDGYGHYRTILMDRGFRFQQMQDRYC